MIFKHGITLGTTVSLLTSTAFTGVRISSIGSLSSDAGLNTLHSTEIAIEEISAADSVGSEKLALVSADTGEGVTEGIKVCEYPTEAGEVDLIISGPIDDVSLG